MKSCFVMGERGTKSGFVSPKVSGSAFSFSIRAWFGKEDIMKASWKRGLRYGVLIMLAAGALGMGHAEAAVIDMTSGEYLKGLTIADPPADIADSLQYRWDKDNQKIIGGDVTVSSNKNGTYIRGNLRISASDFNEMNGTEFKKALAQLAGKITNGLTSSSYKVMSYVQIVDDASKENPKVLQSYNVIFDGSGAHVTGQIGEMEGAYYTSTVRPEGEGSKEFNYRTDGNIQLGFSNPDYSGSEGFVFAPAFTDKEEDNVYAVIRSGSKDVGVVNWENNSTSNTEASFRGDASAHEGSKAYGIYSDSQGKVEVSSTKGTFDIGGEKATGVYAGNQSDGVISTVYLDGKFTFNLQGNQTAGLEAGKNGLITSPEKLHNNGANITISAPGGYALYAHDGGQIKVNQIQVTSSEASSIYAERGGVIDAGTISGITGTISTDSDPASKITGSLKGDYDGDLRGNVALQIAGSWTGNNYSTGDLSVTGGTWNGDMGIDKGSITLQKNGIWNPSAGKGDIHMAKLFGSTDAIRRGYINMAEGTNLHIDKFAGAISFNYQHDGKDPSQMIGGDVVIQAAAPISISSEGIGFGEEEGTVTSTMASTVKLVTPYDEAITDDNVNQVLENLAKKLTYSNYATGERGMTAVAEISEGLTGSSKTKYFTDVSFDPSTGKGSAGTDIYQPVNSVLTGSVKDGSEYDKYGTKDTAGENYTRFDFNEDMYIQKNQSEDDRVQKPYFGSSLYVGLVTNYGSEWNYPGNMFTGAATPTGGPSYTIDMHGHNLTVDLESFPKEGTTGNQPMWTSVGFWATREGTITVDNPGALSITTNANYYYGGALRASTSAATPTGAHIIINNDNDPAHAVVLRGGIPTPGYELNYWTLSSNSLKKLDYGLMNSVTVKGLVDIESKNGPAIYAKGGVITLGGGKVIAHNYDAVTTSGSGDNGRVDINILTDEKGKITGVGNNNVVIEGSVATYTPYWGAGGTINLAMTTDQSRLTGNIYGSGDNNLWLQNGAVWDNEATAHHSWSTGVISESGTDSMVTNLVGGADASHAGIIYQNGKENISIGTLSGYVNVYMEKAQGTLPDGSKDTSSAFSGRGYVEIAHALKTGGQNAVLTVRTDSNGVDLNNDAQVKKVLNQLANRIIYTGYATQERNLTGYAQIAEGLTSSSYQKQMDIIFDETSGSGRVQKEPIGQTKTLFDSVLTGDPKKDKNYMYGGVVTADGYHFNEATLIRPAANAYNNKGIISIQSTQEEGDKPAEVKKLTIQADNGLKLDMGNLTKQMDVTGVYVSNGTQLTVNGDISMDMSNNYTNGTRYGIYQKQENDSDPSEKSTNTTFNGDVHIKITNDIADGSGIPSAYYPRVGKVVGIYNTESAGSTITIHGKADIDVEGTAVLVDNPTDAKSVININGGRIIARNVEATPRDGSGEETVRLNNHSLAAYGGVINVGMETVAPGRGRATEASVLKAGSALVEMEGNILTMKDPLTSAADKNLTDGTINLALTTERSYWKGVADNAGAGKLGTFNLYLQNGAIWHHEKQGSTYNLDTAEEAIGGKWDEISHVSDFIGGPNKRARGIIHQVDEAGIAIDHYSGYAAAIYDHDAKDPSQIKGGSVTIHAADKDSSFTVLTDRNGIDLDNKKQVTGVLSSLAKKLIYANAKAEAGNLKAHAAIGEGITSSLVEYQIGDINFDSATGTGILDPDSVKENTDNNNPIYMGAYETLIMSGAKSAMASSAMLWRSGLQDMNQRMGDLHSVAGLDGAWANVYGGKSKMNRDNTKYETSYQAYQAGYDKALNDDWRAGAAISYTDGEGHYTMGGSGDLNNTIFSIYGTKVSGDGSYLDIVAKAGNVENDYTVYNEMRHYVKGDYKTHGWSGSVEYGKRITKGGGFYVEPQAQVIWGRLEGKNYSALSDMIDGQGNVRTMDIHQDGFDSLIGRVGIAAGRNYANGSGWYAKASLLHEFQGEFKSRFSAEDAKETKVDLGGSWANIQIGGTVKAGKNSVFYASVSKDVGNNDIADSWQVNGGFRYSF